MIPLCSRDKIAIVEDDITWVFNPKIGLLEKELVMAFADTEKMSAKEQMDISDDYIDKILVGWTDNKKRMPNYPEDKKPSKFFSQEEKIQIMLLWKRANTLTAEEKKT